ncbi:MAG: phosphoribosylamine--glycine ligase [Dehalococcoidia bacterium]|nr:phosphoribosylamine--glycine ligase [Dehalococcoidia bacterium]
MRALVLGGGGREHAILWKLAQSPRAPELFQASVNRTAHGLAQHADINPDCPARVVEFVERRGIDLTIVGPERPLMEGVTDALRKHGHAVMGPSQAAARIEWSKAFAKEVMAQAGVPTAASETFTDPDSAKECVRKRGAPIVVKADGLAAGKGVTVAATVEEAATAIDAAMTARVFGDAGMSVVVEDCLVGEEVSVFCFTDGVNASPLIAARDYKRVSDGDQGPNTGGMGGYSPPPYWDAALERRIRETCIEQVLRQLAAMGTPFAGVLFGGLMLTEDGPQVIEFNARLGDPEAQLILPRLENDLLDVAEAVAHGGVGALDLRWSPTATVGVTLASGGYPGTYETGKPIHGLDALPDGVTPFYTGVGEDDVGAPVTDGGRVVTLVGHGATHAEARRLAYDAAAQVRFAGAHYRRDIAAFAGE